MNGSVNFKVRRTSDGWEGTITLPSSQGAAAAIVKARGPTKSSAITRATGLAYQVMDSPIFKALMPPQSALAIRAAGALAKVGPKVARIAVNVLKSKPLKKLAKLFGG